MSLSEESSVLPAPASSLEFALATPSTIPGEVAVALPRLEVYQVWGEAVVAVLLRGPERAVTVGTGLGATPDLVVEGEALPAARYELFVPGPEGWSVRLAPGFSGRLDTDDTSYDLPLEAPRGAIRAEDGGLTVPLGRHDRVQVHVGSSVFVARPVAPARVVPAPSVRADPAGVGIVGGMVALAILVGGVFGLVPPAPAATQNEIESRIIELLPSLPPPPAPAAVQDRKPDPGGRAKGSEGAVRKGNPKGGASRVSDDPKDAGLLGAFADDALQAALGEGGLSADIRAGIGGLVGARSTSTGPGLGSRGTGLGGGGRAAEGGPFGVGDRTGARRAAETSLGTHQEGVTPRASEIITIGGLPASEIDKVVKRRLASIRYCYQRELQKNPSLGGKVSVKFTIAGDGSVSSASTASSTLGNSAAEACMSAEFLKMTFPAPKGGGVVIVKYPFMFTPG